MAWVAVDKNGSEAIYDDKPIRNNVSNWWQSYGFGDENVIELPQGTIEKILGRKLTWSDKPVELTENNNNTK